MNRQKRFFHPRNMTVGYSSLTVQKHDFTTAETGSPLSVLFEYVVYLDVMLRDWCEAQTNIHRENLTSPTYKFNVQHATVGPYFRMLLQSIIKYYRLHQLQPGVTQTLFLETNACVMRAEISN